MSLQKILEQNNKLRAKGQLPGAKGTDTPIPLLKLPNKIALTTLDCVHEGNIIETCKTCGSGGRHVRQCGVHGKCTYIPTKPDIQDCNDCKSNWKGFIPVSDGFVFNSSVGVVIGSYKWPELISLQIQTIRDTCGQIPILISNDHLESDFALDAICSKFKDVTVWTNPERIGHTGGDITAFWKGIRWGAERKLKVVAKLSQRFFITKPNWLQDGATDLLQSGLPLASQHCRGVMQFDLRTEACLLDINAWNHPHILGRIKPRKYWTDTPLGLSAETIIYRVLQDLLGGIYWPWNLLREERYQKADGVIWHNANPVADYRELANKYKIPLPAGFTCDGWQEELRKGEYLYG